jgi:predicted MFS family arabinose efflux permease
MIQTTCFSITGKLYRNQQAVVIAILETSTGLGNTSSPVIGALLFQLGGFMTPFFFYAVICLVFAIILKRVIPDDVDANPISTEVLLPVSQEMQETIPIEIQLKPKMTFLDVLRQPKMFFALLCGCLAYFDGSIFEPILTVRL